jgi:hypothetical protein
MADTSDGRKDLLGDATQPAPTDQTKLSEKDQNTITNWLRERSKAPACPVCNNQPTNWIVGEHLLHGQVYSREGLMFGGMNYPQAFAICDNCFYIRTFMAVPMGLDALKDEGDENV